MWPRHGGSDGGGYGGPLRGIMQLLFFLKKKLNPNNLQSGQDKSRWHKLAC